MQMVLRTDHLDNFSHRCYLYGSSNHNQRIENWWGFLRSQHAQFWINLFQDLKDSDSFSGGFLDKSLIPFTCLEIIEVRTAIGLCSFSSHSAILCTVTSA